MAGKLLSLSIVTPSGTLFKSDEVNLVVAKTTTGEVTILPHHAPLFTKLEHEELRVKINGKNNFFTIFQGFLHLDPGSKITILADNAQRSEKLDVEKIKKAKLAAEKALENREKLSATEIMRAETEIRRALMELKATQRKRSDIH